MIPLSLYIHIPWCVQKCPYCDFNSHALKTAIPENDYITALLNDLEKQLHHVQERKLISIFFGGGTPSLFSPDSIAHLLMQIEKRIEFSTDIEITLEANPGTVEQKNFIGFYQAGVNRLSIGCQSFDDEKLKTLGRIHGKNEAILAANAAKKAGFTNFNLDLMYGLPDQTPDQALLDLKIAIDLQPTHLSWYQLTIEPNTLFHAKPPELPKEDFMWHMNEAGLKLITDNKFDRYEISAFSKNKNQCIHNLNYWLFGDYIGIGAGAHGKITNLNDFSIIRTQQFKQPKAYLNAENPCEINKKILTKDKPFEFMLNALRLMQPIEKKLFEIRTHLKWDVIKNPIEKAQQLGLLIETDNHIALTDHGKLFANEAMTLFLD